MHLVGFTIEILKNINIDIIKPAVLYTKVSNKCVYSHKNFEVFIMKWKYLLAKGKILMFVSIMVKVDESRPLATRPP